MTPLPVVKPRECIKVLEKIGFHVDRQHGSHIILRRDTPYAQVVVPNHVELRRGTLRTIIRDAGLTIEEFVELLK
jgi:predicted RNA binding protein YcfA (HicA-like mRNA interferase family)